MTQKDKRPTRAATRAGHQQAMDRDCDGNSTTEYMVFTAAVFALFVFMPMAIAKLGGWF